MSACKPRPTFIKPNNHELSALVGHELDSTEALVAAGRDILARYGSEVVISRGKNGVLAVLREGCYRIPPIAVEVSSPAGAGDAVLAGLAHAIHHGTPIEEGLRLGVAAATAVCLQPGTAAYDVADMRRFLPQVELIPFLLKPATRLARASQRSRSLISSAALIDVEHSKKSDARMVPQAGQDTILVRVFSYGAVPLNSHI